ncbi:MAG: hypothetical protein EBV03_06525 [Proteobacteria bacterium]|nr:hypothetical protein [Pseudomonadota bacterium]
MANLLITGLPRSGSAVVGALVDYLPDSVCLNAPLWQTAFAKNPVEILPFCKWLAGDALWARGQLLRGIPLPDFRAEDGAPLLDGLRDARQPKNEDGSPKEIYFTRGKLTHGFTLAMRQTTLYTSILPVLLDFTDFRTIAVLRHPLAVCQAWQQLPQPLLAQGNPPGIARFWPEALAAMQAPGDDADRFALLYELYVQRYHELAPRVQVMRYEDVAEDTMMLSRLLGHIVASPAVRWLRPAAPLTRNAFTDAVAARLRRDGVFTKLYYNEF